MNLLLWLRVETHIIYIHVSYLHDEFNSPEVEKKLNWDCHRWLLKITSEFNIMLFMYVGASPPRAMNVTGGGNMHWIHPKVPNGDISHFKIKYTLKNGTQQEINTPYNYQTLTGMEVGHSYNITLMAVHKDGLKGESVMKTYVHYP